MQLDHQWHQYNRRRCCRKYSFALVENHYIQNINTTEIHAFKISRSNSETRCQSWFTRLEAKISSKVKNDRTRFHMWRLYSKTMEEDCAGEWEEYGFKRSRGLQFMKSRWLMTSGVCNKNSIDFCKSPSCICNTRFAILSSSSNLSSIRLISVFPTFILLQARHLSISWVCFPAWSVFAWIAAWAASASIAVPSPSAITFNEFRSRCWSAAEFFDPFSREAILAVFGAFISIIFFSKDGNLQSVDW